MIARHHATVTMLALTMAVTLAFAPVRARADCTEQWGQGEIAGTLLGATLGGLLGSQIGSGTGNTVAIAGGVLAGGLLGNTMGRGLDCRDRAYHENTAQDTFEYTRTGQSSGWKNPDSGHSGSVTPTRTYQRTDGTYCRDFTQSIVVEGRYEDGVGTACRQTDGTWRIVGG